MPDCRTVLPRRIFLDSCTLQTLRDYGEVIYDGGSISPEARILRVPDGVDNVEALRLIILVSQRAQFEWMISPASLDEAAAKGDPPHAAWVYEIADYARSFLQQPFSSNLSMDAALRLDDAKFGYLSTKDRLLLRDAAALQCDAFLTMERRLPKCADHVLRETGVQILTPISYWALLRPWAALWY